MSTSKLIFDIETVGADFDSFDETSQKSLTRWIKRESENDEEYRAALKNLKEELGFSPLTAEIVVIGTLDYEKNQGGIYFQAPGENIGDFTEEGIKFKQMTEKKCLSIFGKKSRRNTRNLFLLMAGNLTVRF